MKKAGKVIMALAAAVVIFMSGFFTGDRMNPNGSLFAGSASQNGSGASTSESKNSSGSGNASDSKTNNTEKKRHNAGNLYKLAGSKRAYQKYIKKQLNEQKKHYGWDIMTNSTEDATTDGAATEQSASTDGVSTTSQSMDYSTTNTIVDGVDEADIVKTNGKYIFRTHGESVKITKADGTKLSACPDIDIIKDVQTAENQDNIHIPASISDSIDSSAIEINEMFLSNEKLILFASVSTSEKWSDYGVVYDDVYSTDDNLTWIFFYDIRNPEKPVLTAAQSMTGAYNTSRILEDGTLLVFTEKYIDDESYYPQINDEDIDANAIYLPVKGLDQILLASFDLSGDSVKIKDACAIVNDNYDAQYYVTNDSLFLYGSDYSNNMTVTDITRFSLGSFIDAVGNATVSGTVRDKFALREIDGNLFILTSTSNWNSSANALYVYDSNMKRIGSLTGIANGEIIYSARYIGNIAYFVTYKNMDPLFAVDISDPTNPKMLGNLEITGFSDYLHPWGKDRLVGIGQETDSDTGESKGIKITMFDISDPLELKVLGSTVIEGNYYSDSVDDYKSILASPEKNILGFSYGGYDKDYTNYQSTYGFYSWNEETKQFDTVAEHSPSFNTTPEFRGLYIGDELYISMNEGILPVRGEEFYY